MIIVTGGAGFIGSCVVRTLNDAGRDDIIIVDNIAETDKWMNMRNKRFIKYVHKSHFLEELPSYKGVEATFRALGMEPNIKYIDMPENLRGKYQYYTQAEMGKLYNTGYPMPFLDVAHGVTDYVQNHLAKDYLTY